MTAQEAIKLLHPDTTKEAIAEIKYYCGFHGKEAAIKAIEEACLLACDALEKQVPKEPKVSERKIRYCEVWQCPTCGFEWSSRVVEYCYRCGQAIDWTKEEGER